MVGPIERADRQEQAGNITEAIDILIEFLEANPDCIDAWRMLARLASDIQTQTFCWEQITQLCPERNTPRSLLTSLRFLAEKRRQQGSNPRKDNSHLIL